MFDLFGTEMPLAAKFFIAFAVVLALIGLTAWLVRRFGANRLGGAGARGRQPRLAVIDAATRRASVSTCRTTCSTACPSPPCARMMITGSSTAHLAPAGANAPLPGRCEQAPETLHPAWSA